MPYHTGPHYSLKYYCSCQALNDLKPENRAVAKKMGGNGIGTKDSNHNTSMNE